MNSFKKQIPLEILYNKLEFSRTNESFSHLSNRTFVAFMMLVRNTIKSKYFWSDIVMYDKTEEIQMLYNTQ